MTMVRAVLCAASMAILAGGPALAAEKKAETKREVRRVGKTETLACRLGNEDRHARIAVVLVGGKTDSFAYYSKWKPRTCSVYLQRSRDPYSKWADNGDITTVSIEKGAFLIEHRKNGEYHFIFRDVDRERYCGMDGVINGSLTIKKGSEACVLGGDIMVEGTPLGEANVARKMDMPEPAQGASDVRQSGLQPAAAPTPAAAPASTAAVPAAPAATTAPAMTTAPAAATPPATASAPAAPAPEQKAGESGFRAFFRGLSTSRPDETSKNP
jgi:hypothetical protein